MSSIKITKLKKFKIYTAVVFVLLMNLLTQSRPTLADELFSRSVNISSSFTSAVTSHTYTYTTVGASNVSSVEFEYCSNTPLFDIPCTPPPGLDVSGFNIGSQSGITGFGISGSTTNNKIIITKAPLVHPATTSQYVFNNIVNPSTAFQTVYVRIGIFDGPDATGTRIDQGAVAFAMLDQYQLNLFVPPQLTFCVGITVTLDCSSTSGVVASFGEFNTDQATATTTQFAASTNDSSGYNTFIKGSTMTSGNNVILPLTVKTPSILGVSQFGINLRSNSNPTVGADPELGPEASGAPDTEYNTINNYKFVDGDRIAGSTISTGFNRYTISYIVNVDTAQAPGVYSSTLEFTTIATF